MKSLSVHGIREFIICCGYKGYLIKEYFANYFLHTADVTIDILENKMHVHHAHAESWKVTVADTGLDTMTGGRLLRIREYVDGEQFMLTYGDGVSDIHIPSLINLHSRVNAYATITAVQAAGRFGALDIDGAFVRRFVEKPIGDGHWINGGFFVLEPNIFDYLRSDQDIWEQGPLQQLSEEGRLAAHQHNGFWSAMDTLRDRNYLEELWASNRAPWKIWP
jgi:glucose-1-phosphate cytidylyltransferase